MYAVLTWKILATSGRQHNIIWYTINNIIRGGLKIIHIVIIYHVCMIHQMLVWLNSFWLYNFSHAIHIRQVEFLSRVLKTPIYIRIIMVLFLLSTSPPLMGTRTDAFLMFWDSYKGPNQKRTFFWYFHTVFLLTVSLPVSCELLKNKKLIQFFLYKTIQWFTFKLS